MIDKNNKSFCVIPFISTMINTDTTVRYCCMPNDTNVLLKDDNSAYTCKDNFIKDSWNCDDIKQIRMNMINGVPVSGCSVCYLQESSGRDSNRQHANREWTSKLGEDYINEVIWQAAETEGAIEEDIVYLDLRLGNLCNLKCRMCNPWNSSQIAREHIELEARDSEYKRVWSKSFGEFPIKVLDDQQWFDHDIMWDQIISLVPKLKKVYMTGGEPTLIKQNFRFMQSCIDQSRKDILLFFNTNCTNINRRFLDLIKQFDQININASIDGVGSVNEYIRAPSNWQQISENVEKLAEMSNVNLGITPTVQVYNVFDTINILKWVDYLNAKYNRDIFVDFLINIHPHTMNVNILPDDIRYQAAQELTVYLDSKEHHHDLTRNSINGIIGLLNGERSSDADQLLRDLKDYTSILDRERNQSVNILDQRLVKLFMDI